MQFLNDCSQTVVEKNLIEFIVHDKRTFSCEITQLGQKVELIFSVLESTDGNVSIDITEAVQNENEHDLSKRKSLPPMSTQEASKLFNVWIQFCIDHSSLNDKLVAKEKKQIQKEIKREIEGIHQEIIATKQENADDNVKTRKAIYGLDTKINVLSLAIAVVLGALALFDTFISNSDRIFSWNHPVETIAFIAMVIVWVFAAWHTNRLIKKLTTFE